MGHSNIVELILPIFLLKCLWFSEKVLRLLRLSCGICMRFEWWFMPLKNKCIYRSTNSITFTLYSFPLPFIKTIKSDQLTWLFYHFDAVRCSSSNVAHKVFALEYCHLAMTMSHILSITATQKRFKCNRILKWAYSMNLYLNSWLKQTVKFAKAFKLLSSKMEHMQSPYHCNV